MGNKTDSRLYIEIGMKVVILAVLILLGVFVPVVQTAFLAAAYFMMFLPPLAILFICLYMFFWYVPFFKYEDFSKKKAFQRSLFVTALTFVVCAVFVSRF